MRGWTGWQGALRSIMALGPPPSAGSGQALCGRRDDEDGARTEGEIPHFAALHSE